MLVCIYAYIASRVILHSYVAIYRSRERCVRICLGKNGGFTVSPGRAAAGPREPQPGSPTARPSDPPGEAAVAGSCRPPFPQKTGSARAPRRHAACKKTALALGSGGGLKCFLAQIPEYRAAKIHTGEDIITFGRRKKKKRLSPNNFPFRGFSFSCFLVEGQVRRSDYSEQTPHRQV